MFKTYFEVPASILTPFTWPVSHSAPLLESISRRITAAMLLASNYPAIVVIPPSVLTSEELVHYNPENCDAIMRFIDKDPQFLDFLLKHDSLLEPILREVAGSDPGPGAMLLIMALTLRAYYLDLPLKF